MTCVEHLLGGALTTVLFALMMRHTDREIGATHYTLLAELYNELWTLFKAELDLSDAA